MFDFSSPLNTYLSVYAHFRVYGLGLKFRYTYVYHLYVCATHPATHALTHAATHAVTQPATPAVTHARHICM